MLYTNTDAAVNVLEFVRASDHAGLVTSTCYGRANRMAGQREADSHHNPPVYQT